MANRGTLVGAGGAAAGYFLYKSSPVIGAAVGFFVGRMIGKRMDEVEAKSRVQAGQAELARQLEQQGGPT